MNLHSKQSHNPKENSHYLLLLKVMLAWEEKAATLCPEGREVQGAHLALLFSIRFALLLKAFMATIY